MYLKYFKYLIRKCFCCKIYENEEKKYDKEFSKECTISVNNEFPIGSSDEDFEFI